MSINDKQNGWNEYSKLVLKELESLSANIDNLNSQIQDIKQEMVETRVKEDRVEELRVWREKIDEVASPTQLKELIEKVDSLNTFKVKAVGVFIAVQFMMGALAWFMKLGG